MSSTDREAGARALAARIGRSARTVALTGAGISTDSGIPDFRSPASGLWTRADPGEVASIEGFLDDPVRFYDFWRERFGALAEAAPNLAHRVLAALETRSLLSLVITQNIDGLHQKAGSRRVLEVHGSFRTVRCRTCGARAETARVLAELPRGQAAKCARCGGLLKPEVVLFGEPLPDAFGEAERAVDDCDLLIVLGSSLEVWPVAGLAPRARHGGAELAIVSREPTAADGGADLVIRGELRDVMAIVARELDLPVG